jgi:hypothetical protein
MNTNDERLRTSARFGLQRLVREQVTDIDPAAFEVRPPWPGAPEPFRAGRHPLALPALTATRRILQEAKRAETEAIAHARGQGHTWTQIGHALGEPFVKAAKRAELSLAEAAWRYATYRIMPDQDISWRASWQRDEITWRCWTCHQSIREGHPDDGPDAQQGHAPGCQRRRSQP